MQTELDLKETWVSFIENLFSNNSGHDQELFTYHFEQVFYSIS